MIEGRSLELEELCTYCTGNPDDPVSLQRLQNECRRIGTRMISASSYILPKDVRMVYETFRGRGTIAFNRT
ncbi:MAG TPA: hypothetical protein ENG09_01725, partial [Candidatus Syntrophoarchaeum butanivorans]|nr:hypothetical protein [Candidatus Syntrophoarchaeum butanivorans]